MGIDGHQHLHLTSNNTSTGNQTSLSQDNTINQTTKMAPHLRSLYRRFLREMPTRTPSLLANPSPLQKHIRTDITATSSSDSPSLAHQLKTKSAEARVQEAEQYLQFVQQQRLYSTLVERYNPGMDMTEEERVRLTARRVGMELPVEAMMGNDGKDE
jgi:ATP synthase assembly factor FMC1